MKPKDFQRLVASVKQAGAIRRKRLRPGRTTEIHPQAVRDLRARLEQHAQIHDAPTHNAPGLRRH